MDVTQLTKKAEEMSLVLKALANPDRLRTLCALIEGEKTVGELTEFTGASQSMMSQHLSRMKEEGIVTSRRDHNKMYYSISNSKIKKLMKMMKEVYCD